MLRRAAGRLLLHSALRMQVPWVRRLSSASGKEKRMKVAEALTERADLDKKIKSLRERARGAARYVEGEEPTEDANELLVSARELLHRHGELVARINLTNARAELEPGLTMTEALARRARLTDEIALLNALADEASPGRDPYGRGRRRTELPEKTDLPVKGLRTEADRLAKQHRELDAKIQFANWNTELI